MSRDERAANLFSRAIDEPPSRWSEFLARECPDDPALRSHLLQLLESDRQAEEATFLAVPALDLTTPEVTFRPGNRIGPYRLEALIGSGGMGAVFRAVRDDTEYNRTVAIKVIQDGLDTAQIARRFRHERQILAGLSHPHITQLLDGGTTKNGMPYFVMEYIAGESVDEWCRTHALRLDDRLRLFQKICAAVHYAHQRMVIHRDLKPANILVTAGGEPKLLDFGIARLLTHDTDAARAATQAGFVILTPRYASPEQLHGESVTAASDQYSLGVLLYELLTGEPVRKDSGTGEALKPSAAVKDDALRRKLRGDLDRIILTALQREPALRYGSVDQFSDDLQRVLDGRPVRARGEGAVYIATKFVRRHKLAASSVLALLLSLTAGIVATTRAQRRAERRFQQLHSLAHSVVFDYHDAIESLPGATPVRAKIVRDALQYLDSLSAEADDPALQRELLASYVKLSNVQGNGFYANLGDSAGALNTARKAVALGRRLLERDHSAQSETAVAQAYSAEGSLLWSLDDLRAAAESFPKAIALEESVGRREPQDVGNLVRWSEDLRALHDVLGAEGMANLGRTKEAAALQYKALEVSNRAIQLAPQSREAQGEHYHALMANAEAAHLDDNHSASSRLYTEALAVQERLRAQGPDSPLAQRNTANTLDRVARERQEMGDRIAAREAFLRAIEIQTKACAADPRDALGRRMMQVLYGHAAELLLELGEVDGALDDSRKSLSLAQSMSAADPRNSEYQSGVAIAHRRLAAALLAKGDAAAAFHEASDGIALFERMAQTSQDNNVQMSLMRARTGRGDIERKLGRVAAAREDYAAAARRASGLLARDATNSRILLERAVSRLRESLCLEALRRKPEAAQAYADAALDWRQLNDRHAIPASYRALPEVAALLRP